MIIVSGGAKFSSGETRLERGAVVTLRDAGTVWDNFTEYYPNGEVNIARSSNGVLNIENGAVMNSAYVSVSLFTNSKGFLNVTDDGSLLNITRTLSVGENGESTINITNGGRLVANKLEMGKYHSGVGTINISGENSKLHINGEFNMEGEGVSIVNISDGATVYAETLKMGNLSAIQMNNGIFILNHLVMEEFGRVGGSGKVFTHGTRLDESYIILMMILI